MLRFFTKFQRSRNFVLLLFCFILLVGLVIFYIPNTPFGNNQMLASNEGNDVVIAKVGSREIKLKQYRAAMAAMGSRFSQGNTLPFATLRALGVDKETLDRLIEEKIALSEADKLNIQGTDRDVSDQVTRAFVDPETSKFIGVEEYMRRLRLNGENVNEYEQAIRDNAAIMRLRRYVISSNQISDREIEESFKQDNTKVDLVYTIVDLEKVRSKFKPSEEELRAYYDKNKEQFKATEPVRKIDYLLISTDEVAKGLKLTEQELRAEYDQNKQYEPRVSVIKLNVPTPDDENTVNAKISELNRRVRGSQGVAPEDFATVARGNSQDPSATKGGDVGFIKKDANNSQDWRQRAFNLKAGEIDGPFRFGQSYYIMKVAEQREVPFAEMRATIEAGLRNRKAYSEASLLADKAFEKATEYKDIHKAAAEIAKEMNLSADKIIRSTPFFKSGDTLPEIGNNPAFHEAVSQLKKSDIGDKVQIPGGLAVPQVSDIREQGQQLSFEEARNMVEQKLREEREPDLARQRAQEIVNKAKTPAEFEALLKAEGLEPKPDTNFGSLTAPGTAAGGLQSLQQAQAASRGVKEGEIFKTPIKFGAGYLIFAAKKRTEADLSRLANEREGVRTRLLNERQLVSYDAFIKMMRKRYEQEGWIKIYQDRIDSYFNQNQQ